MRILGTTFRGPAPLKLGKAKNVQNLAPFWTTSEFDREYLRQGLIYRQAKKWRCQLQSVLRSIKILGKPQSSVASFRPTKNQQCARFRPTLDFDRQCLWNITRYQQTENDVINDNHSCVARKKWWTLVHWPRSLVVYFDLPKITAARARLLLLSGTWRC